MTPRIKQLNLLVKQMLKNYNIKIADYPYIDQVITHDADEFELTLTTNEIKYIKAAIKMLLYKKEIEYYDTRKTENRSSLFKFDAED